MTDYNGIYNKLTKKELLYTLIARDAMLKDCRERFELHKNTDAKTIQDQSDLIEELKEQIAESEKKLNQYPYKNDVIEKQYEELKDGIKFRIENNITDDWEQHYHCIDVLCEKHKSRIRDIEDGICRIEQLEQQLAEKEKSLLSDRFEQSVEACYEDIAQDIKNYKNLFNITNQEKISFAVEQLEKVRESVLGMDKTEIKTLKNGFSTLYVDRPEVITKLDNQIKQLKEMK